MTGCDFCGATPDVVGSLHHYEHIAICTECTTSFSHQLGHREGRCTNCGRETPDAIRLHGERQSRICEVCLTAGPAESSQPPMRAAEAALTHLRDDGAIHMVDVSGKPPTERRAAAEAVVRMPAELAARFFTGDLPKGDAVATVRLAAITGSKRTWELIPLAHPIGLTSVTVDVEPHPDGVRIEATCATTDRTGVEMEALTAVSLAALTLYDMVKSVERGVVIGPIRLLAKSGGRSGHWKAED